MSRYEITKLEALRWTMKTWARVWFKKEDKYSAGRKLGMPEWFPFSCGCCAYVAGEPCDSMEGYECVDETKPCPMLEVWNISPDFDPEEGVPCERSGSPYRYYMNDRRTLFTQDIFLGARRLYLQELKLQRERKSK